MKKTKYNMHSNGLPDLSSISKQFGEKYYFPKLLNK
jgi:hypothetical protein